MEAFTMKYTFSIMTQDSPGVLMRISNMLFRRNFSIDSLTVNRTNMPNVSCFTVVIECDERTCDQVKKQLGKLVEVFSIEHINEPLKAAEPSITLVSSAAEDAMPMVHRMASAF